MVLAAPHSPVMTAEVVKALDPGEDSILVDATFGRG
ncbi:MAG TPA: 16S rRNA (cytosine(1402)-N(4))-methyltransferase, partial [Gammaproteobacteria bacterium]|nr:16S rRNA (cytosine(1402)-N(4))-methyltransferase [Gammaproteobacteria bacterium]